MRCRHSSRLMAAGWSGGIVVLMTLACWLCATASASEASRFPKPEFRETGYEYPAEQHPLARPEVFEILDLVVLGAALALAAGLALRWRSRRGLALLAFAAVVYFGFWRQGCVCAVGSLQNIAFASAFGARLPWTVILIFMLPLLMALVVGRVFCASVCPIGAVQELVLLRSSTVPGWLDRPLRLLPYVYLILALLFAATGTAFLVCRYDPVVSIFRLNAPIRIALLTGGLLLVATVIGRPYCRYACPYGALLNLLSRLSAWHLSITPDHCVNCRLCEDACPYGAIHPPQPKPLADERPRERRILLLILLGTPLLMAFGAWAGWRLAPRVAAEHPTVLAAEAIQGAAATDAEARDRLDAIRQSNIAEKTVLLEAAAVRERINYASALAGGAIGLVLGGGFFSLTIRRRREGYEPDRGLCVSCGRCFHACPREHAARRPATPDGGTTS